MQKNMMWILAALSFTLGCGDKDASTDSGADDSATDDTSTDTNPVGLEIVGEWETSWGATYVITDTSWVADKYSYAITVYDNDADYFVAQNADTNFLDPGLWTRFDWTWDGDALYYCELVGNAASQAEAEAATEADRADLVEGCGGGNWLSLTAL
jgi:hypothetical protein